MGWTTRERHRGGGGRQTEGSHGGGKRTAKAGVGEAGATGEGKRAQPTKGSPSHHPGRAGSRQQGRNYAAVRQCGPAPPRAAWPQAHTPRSAPPPPTAPPTTRQRQDNPRRAGRGGGEASGGRRTHGQRARGIRGKEGVVTGEGGGPGGAVRAQAGKISKEAPEAGDSRAGDNNMHRVGQGARGRAK